MVKKSDLSLLEQMKEFQEHIKMQKENDDYRGRVVKRFYKHIMCDERELAHINVPSGFKNFLEPYTTKELLIPIVCKEYEPGTKNTFPSLMKRYNVRKSFLRSTIGNRTAKAKGKDNDPGIWSTEYPEVVKKYFPDWEPAEVDENYRDPSTPKFPGQYFLPYPSEEE